jgi:putative transposase
MRLAHSPALCELYPPGRNPHGEGHWPLLRVLVAHDVRTGLGMRPEWGAMHGPRAVSEQPLLETAIDRLRSGSTVIGDANFGVFSVAYAATQRGHPVLLRLTAQRAQRVAGGVLRDGIDRMLAWKPSAADRRSHPKLPADACVTGRLMIRQVQPDNGTASFLLVLFTTQPPSQTEVFELYGQRWEIETDRYISGGVSTRCHGRRSLAPKRMWLWPEQRRKA